jgi:putative PIN family toxin of toxin-antitoxin system
VADSASGEPALVIDSNVVLNWLFFKDAPTVTVIERLLQNHRWVCTEWMQREAQRVATLPQMAKYTNNAAIAALAQGFAEHATFITHSTVSPMCCRDEDDQAFLDLAAHTQAPLLLTLDRDLLKHCKRAKALGLNIVQPFKIAV